MTYLKRISIYIVHRWHQIEHSHETIHKIETSKGLKQIEYSALVPNLTIYDISLYTLDFWDFQERILESNDGLIVYALNSSIFVN